MTRALLSIAAAYLAVGVFVLVACALEPPRRRQRPLSLLAGDHDDRPTRRPGPTAGPDDPVRTPEAWAS